MPNIAALLKSEISRVARKEIRAHNEAVAKTTRTQKTDIGALKRRVQELEQLVKKLAKGAPLRPPVKTTGDARLTRFSAKGMASHRKRIGLNADDYGRLLGASGNTIYNWESGASKPRASFHAAIADARTLGKREAVARLARDGG